MGTKSAAPVEGVPDLTVDTTFPHLVVGLAGCSDTRTVEKFLRGESVGRSAIEREVLMDRLLKATRRAVALRKDNPIGVTKRGAK